MHQLTASGGRLRAVRGRCCRLIDVELEGSVRRTTSLLSKMCQSDTYNGHIEAVEVMPPLLPCSHDIDFVVLEVFPIPYTGEHGFGLAAQRAVITSEQSKA